MTYLLLACLVSIALTGAVTWTLRRAAVYDVPNDRSSHSAPVPRGGGLAVVAAIAVVTLAHPSMDVWVVALVVAAACLALVGLVDDFRNLDSRARLAVQAGVSVVGVALALAYGSGGLGWSWLPLLAFAAVGYVNAFNFMDGINGISALTCVVVGGWWGWVGQTEGHPVLWVSGLALAGAALGFLPWNAPRARVFLGDVGSYGLGTFIAGMSLVALASGVSPMMAVVPLVVYCADTGWVLIKRAVGGRPLMKPHREHVYQRLVDGGWSHLTSALWCASVTALQCLSVALWWAEYPWATLGVVTSLGIAYLASPHLARTGRGES